jgi:hypothetical protein
MLKIPHEKSFQKYHFSLQASTMPTGVYGITTDTNPSEECCLCTSIKMSNVPISKVPEAIKIK